MPDYIFKTYIDSGREYYEYTDATDREQTIKKDFPFPESLMELLYMDTQGLEAITKSWKPSPRKWTKPCWLFTSPAPRMTCRS